MPSGMSPNMKKWCETENGGVFGFDGKRQKKLFPSDPPAAASSPYNSMPCVQKDHLCPHIQWNKEIPIMLCNITHDPCDYPMERVPHPAFPNGFQVFVNPVPACPNFKVKELKTGE